MTKITLNKKELELLMECAKSAIATSYDRPILTYIKIDVTETHIIGVTLDGYRLAKLEILHEQEVEPFSCCIKPFNIPKDLQTADIESINGEAIVKLNCLNYTLTYGFTQPKDKFIEYGTIIPRTDKTLSAAFNAKLLISALKPFCKNADPHCVVEISFARDENGISSLRPALLSRHTSDELIDMVVLPIRRREG